MKKFVSTTLALAMAVGASMALAVSTPAHAGEYGTAGCGLGAMIFGDKEGFVQVIAATFNGSFGSQTFGISTGTSECDDSAQQEMKEMTSQYIDGNREALAKEIAQGQGETLAGLSAVAGCSDAAAVGSTLQANYGTIFPSADVSNQDVSAAIIGTLQQDAAMCTL